VKPAHRKRFASVKAPSVAIGLMHIGKDRGLFAKYGLTTEVIYIPGGSINVQVLVSGNLDLSQLSGAPGVAANLEGADIVYFVGLSTN
jgi:ABC-type nitrate/sulfonate/bicarbonate transport system substrate-binding protein